MKTIYAIRDRIAKDLAGTYPLVVFRTDAQAVRYFQDSINQENTSLHAHPMDYELVKLGTIDDDGNIVPTDPFMNIIITGATLLAAQNQPETH